MPGFRYLAYNIDGRLHKGVLEADSARQARALLRDQGLTPHRVEVIAANDPAGGARFRPVGLTSTQLTQLTRGLALALAPSVRVNAVAPGVVDSSWFTHLVGDEAARAVFDAAKAATPLGRTLEPGDVSEVVLHLLAADAVTGETVIVDGGRGITY